jgi:hypothetical protein
VSEPKSQALLRRALTSNNLMLMRVERWFNVLVLGGAALGNACGREAAEQGGTPPHPSDGGTTSTVVDSTDSGTSGATSSGGTNATSNSGGDGTSSSGGSSGSGGSSRAGAPSSSGAAGAPTDGGQSGMGGTGAMETGGKAALGGAGSGGSAGNEAALACHPDANGFGKAADPCGCSCCWARDCLNTQDCFADMAEESADDELRHAKLCQELIAHFGGEPSTAPDLSAAPLAPPGVDGRERVLYEVIAFSCVTETLSTALLSELVARAHDPRCRRAMHDILRDEVNHSRLGWALLAQEHARGARDCVGRHLPQMLRDTLGSDFFSTEMALGPYESELSGLGVLTRADRQRIVRETFDAVIWPGLERFGIDTVPGRSWTARPQR